jgi:Holliday junction resolvase RusA-like endonuclease
MRRREARAMIVVRIPGRPPTPNARRHWRTTHRDNAEWKEYARRCAVYALQAHGDVRPHLEHADVAIEFVVPDKRRRDIDNLISAQKPCLDGIVASGLLADDSGDVIRSVSYSVRYEKGVSETVYRITPV